MDNREGRERAKLLLAAGCATYALAFLLAALTIAALVWAWKQVGL